MRDITHASRVTVTLVTCDPRARAHLCGRARLRPTPTPTKDHRSSTHTNRSNRQLRPPRDRAAVCLTGGQE